MHASKQTGVVVCVFVCCFDCGLQAINQILLPCANSGGGGGCHFTHMQRRGLPRQEGRHVLQQQASLLLFVVVWECGSPSVCVGVRGDRGWWWHKKDKEGGEKRKSKQSDGRAIHNVSYFKATGISKSQQTHKQATNSDHADDKDTEEEGLCWWAVGCAVAVYRWCHVPFGWCSVCSACAGSGRSSCCPHRSCFTR